MEALLREMVTGRRPPGSQMPSVRELAEELRVNPNTVQRVYQEMERNGWTFSRRGQGTFVVDDPPKLQALREALARQAVRSCLTDLQELGYTPEDIRTLIAQELMQQERGELQDRGDQQDRGEEART